ncbi:MAG: hypothetical protein LBS62_12155 [Clostridiales bacterium]|jgi:predicted Zn-dependent protease|nr:hypothetical protein [Clostridiales bacterium]
MADDKGLLNWLLDAKRGVELGLINAFADLESFAAEAPFLDDALICAEIDKLKAVYQRNAGELEQYERFDGGGEYQRQKRELYGQQMAIRAELAYLFSHNTAAIDDCIGLMKGIQSEFTVCLEAMKLYTQGDGAAAFERFTEYIRLTDSIPEHYLACRMYGDLMMRRRNYRHAIPFLRKAAGQRPDEADVHDMLRECYQHENMDFELSVESAIAGLLACDNLGRLGTSGGYARIEGKAGGEGQE